MASETTAAAVGKSGVLRRDPMAMLPFCGYHMGDYFNHWLHMGDNIPVKPKVFYVNWFRKDAEGNFLWPGFGENVRPLIWMLERIKGTAHAEETPIGLLPTPDALHLNGLDIAPEILEQLLAVDAEEWLTEISDIEKHFAKFGEKLPAALKGELAALQARLLAVLPRSNVEALNCPNCGHAFEKTEKSGVKVAACPQCDSVYMSREALHNLLIEAIPHLLQDEVSDFLNDYLVSGLDQEPIPHSTHGYDLHANIRRHVLRDRKNIESAISKLFATNGKGK